MTSTIRAVALLRVLLVVVFCGFVVGQTLSMPGQFAHMAAEEPALAWLRWPLTVAAVLGLACGQVVLVCIWRLLEMVKADRIFSSDAFRWVDAIVWGVFGAWAFFPAGAGALVLTLYLTPELRDPGLPILLGGTTLVGLVVVLLVVVLRALLRQAAQLRTDMEGVI